jgi:lactate permease
VLALVALLPILLLVGLLAGARWTAAKAGLTSAAAAAALAAFGFGYGTGTADWLGPLLEAGFIAGTILWIIFGALCIHEYQTKSGGVAVLGRWLSSFGEDRRVTALFIAWFFALFLEGAAGFGTPIALAAPLLVGLGFSPARALILVLIGHSAGVSFGAVGTPILPLLAAAAISPTGLSLGIALLNAALGWALAALVFKMANVRASGGWSWPLAAALAFFLPYAALAGLTGPELPTLGGALAGALAFAALARASHPRAASGIPPSELFASALPYLLVIGIILLTRLVSPLQDALAAATIEWSYAERFRGAAAPLYHPGTILILAFLATGLLRGGAGLAPAAASAARRLPMVALALFAVLVLARIMVHSGMIDLLAAYAAGTMGAAFPLVAPAIGALGSFITGSATGSNIIFAEFQVATAEAAGLPVILTLAGQGMGAGIGNIIAPHNIIAGAATVGLIGGEGLVLRRTLPICLAYAAAAGALLFAASFILQSTL